MQLKNKINMTSEDLLKLGFVLNRECRFFKQFSYGHEDGYIYTLDKKIFVIKLVNSISKDVSWYMYDNKTEKVGSKISSLNAIILHSKWTTKDIENEIIAAEKALKKLKTKYNTQTKVIKKLEKSIQNFSETFEQLPLF